MSDHGLAAGDEGDEVADLQGRLQFLGYYEGQVNGVFDAALEHAVREYQHAIGDSGTGALDPHHVQALHHSTDGHQYDPGTGRAGGYVHNVALRREQEQAQLQSAVSVDTIEAEAGGRAEHFAQDDGSTLHGNHQAYYDNVIHSLNHVSTRALALAAHNDAAFIRACQAFKSDYAMPKMHEIEGKVTGEDLAKQLVRSVMDITGVRVCAKVGAGVAKIIIEQVSISLARRASGAAKSALAVDGTIKGLQQAMESAITEIETSHAVYEEIARETMTAAFAPLYLAAQNQQPLGDEDNDWIGRFYQAGDAQTDEGIEEVFGIPGPGKTAEMEVYVYEKLVEDFTLLAITRTESVPLFGDRRSAGEQYHDDPARRARAAAREAGDARAARLGHPGT